MYLADKIKSLESSIATFSSEREKQLEKERERETETDRKCRSQFCNPNSLMNLKHILIAMNNQLSTYYLSTIIVRPYSPIMRSSSGT